MAPTRDGLRVRTDILRVITDEWQTASQICYAAYSRCVQDGSEVSVGRYLRVLAGEGKVEQRMMKNRRGVHARHFKKLADTEGVKP